MNWRTSLSGLLLIGAIGAAGGCSQANASGDTQRGATLYVYCAQCHGEDGSGYEKFRAPAIAGMPAWYVESQLHKFQDGARGDHPDDVDGLRMRPMSRTLKSDDDVQAVAAYVESMGPANPSPTVEGGDARKGKQLYATCVSCHGEKAEGKLENKGPPLTSTSDWYLMAQLKKFKAGIRGTDGEDVTGGQMRPLAVSLDDQAMKDIVAYITTLR
jgi:cytochrome c oxidase subunit 2